LKELKEFEEFKEEKEPEFRSQEGSPRAGGEPLWSLPKDLVIFFPMREKAKISC
jgi:hypothetical protein